MTAQPLSVLSVVSEIPHGTADAIIEGVRDKIGSVSRQAVCDALGLLSQKGLIRKIQPAGSPALNEDRVEDNRHHDFADAQALLREATYVETEGNHDLISVPKHGYLIVLFFFLTGTPTPFFGRETVRVRRSGAESDSQTKRRSNSGRSLNRNGASSKAAGPGRNRAPLA